MTDPFAFALAAFILFATPGPTNVLLAASGAAAGFFRSVHLSAVATFAYLLSTTALALVVGPIASQSVALNIGLRVVCGAFLLFAAWRLWREGGMTNIDAAPVQTRRVFLATALNPKAIIFAYVIVPFLAQGDVISAGPYLLALVVLGLISCTGWIAAGSAARSAANGALQSGVARRAGAVLLSVFASLILVSAFNL